MKKNLKNFPYLYFWAEDWGEMQTTNGDYNQSRLTLLDEGGTFYKDENSNSLEEAFEKAEKFLRKENNFDELSIEELEKEYRDLGLD